MICARSGIPAIGCVIAAVFLCLGIPHAWADAPSLDALWRQAETYEIQGLYDDAVLVYESILLVKPDSQRAEVMVAVNLVRAGRAAEALSRIDAGIDLNPWGREWAERALLFKARACRILGCTNDALEAVAILKERFPDSIHTTAAEIVEAQLDSRPTLGAEAAYALELAAEQAHDAAIAAAEAGDVIGALALFDSVIASYPDTRQALRSTEEKALLLKRQPGRESEARAAFQLILDELETTATQSRIRHAAELNIAELDHGAGDRSSAFSRYVSVANTAVDPISVSIAAVEAGVVKLEMLQLERMSGREPSAADWDSVRRLCNRVDSLARVEPRYRVRAALKTVEALAWAGLSRQAVLAAETFLSSVNGAANPRETATVRFLAAEELQKQGNFRQALALYSAIVSAYPDDREIWLGGEHLARTRFRVWEVLREMGAPSVQVDAAASQLQTFFPNSSYAEHVRIVQRQEAE